METKTTKLQTNQKFEFKVKIAETDKETAKSKLVGLLEIGSKITAEDVESLKTALESNPKIIPFIKNIINEYDTENLTMFSVMAIAKKTFETFKN